MGQVGTGTYAIDARKTSQRERRFYERWEPLVLVPGAAPISTDLAEAHYYGSQGGTLCGYVENAFRDPL